MSRVEAYRQIVSARAGGACEYCRLIEVATGNTFHIDHAQPRSAGGATNLANLVFSCPGCNLSKAGRTTGSDLSGRTRQLYNPRDYEPGVLGWLLHFGLDRRTGLILPRSPIGEATP
ncbi:MAG: HNH endonuclease signature motif containing protein [Pirellulaceae bacterium]|nr:HNH endonuclease signature motif containing protein [Pirellulaceae bacterium]